MNLADIAAARAKVHNARKALLVTHVSPDGDALGSLLGLGWALRRLGKTVTFACDDKVPEHFHFLPGAGEIVSQVAGEFDLFAALDCADAERMGQAGQAVGRAPDLNFDHHVTNTRFAAINFVDAEAAATAELLFDLLEPLGLALDPAVAECLLTGIVADTLGFRVAGTTPKALNAAERLMRAGADLPKIYNQSLNSRSLSAARLWGEGLMRLQQRDGMVWTQLPLAARRAAGYQGLGDADLINILSTIREAKVALIFVEREGGEVKVSWRAAPGFDVSEIATRFGGGGHPAAAGAEVKGTLDEVEGRVLAATQTAMEQQKRARRSAERQ